VKTILLVEDDPATARALVRLLGDYGRVQHAGSLSEARVRLLYGPKVDLVVTDWRFPAEPSGPELEGAGVRVLAYARQVKAPAVVFSGSEQPAEGVPWVVKGDVDGLRAAVREELDR